jgi:hypothetical protein
VSSVAPPTAQCHDILIYLELKSNGASCPWLKPLKLSLKESFLL